MYYHTVVLLLFRPFLKVELMDSDISPRLKCTGSARKISSLASTYKSIYGLRCSIVTLTHLISTACITHLLDLPDCVAARGLEQGIRDLKQLAENHAIAKRYLHILVGLSEQWHMTLPENVAHVEAVGAIVGAGGSCWNIGAIGTVGAGGAVWARLTNWIGLAWFLRNTKTYIVFFVESRPLCSSHQRPQISGRFSCSADFPFTHFVLPAPATSYSSIWPNRRNFLT